MPTLWVAFWKMIVNACVARERDHQFSIHLADSDRLTRPLQSTSGVGKTCLSLSRSSLFSYRVILWQRIASSLISLHRLTQPHHSSAQTNELERNFQWKIRFTRMHITESGNRDRSDSHLGCDLESIKVWDHQRNSIVIPKDPSDSRESNGNG